MSNAFWALQGLLLVALIVTAVRVELDRRREERASTRRVPVERRRAAARAIRLKSVEDQEPSRLPRLATLDAGLGNFTLRERARLLLLRGSVQDARIGHGHLLDDLKADASGRWIVSGTTHASPPPPAERPVRLSRAIGSDGASLSDAMPPPPSRSPSDRLPPPRRGPTRRWTGRQVTLALAAVLLIVGALGVVRTNLAMQAIDPGTSMTARLVPGLLANPGKYAKAVNGSTPGGASLEAVAFLQQKQAMDRWEAALVFGAALLLATRRTPASEAPRPEGEAARESSVANDFLPFLFVAALLFGALSFFELP